MKKNIKIKRVYDEYSSKDGIRILIDRLWPRGVKKEDARIDEWMKDIAPSDSLRKWFNHDPEKWGEFKKKFSAELSKNKKLCEELVNKGRTNLTLIYSAKDEEHNNAVVLKNYLEKHFLS
ncbi:MAG: DUF488 domain-containing protein [Ignavibacteriaceae bacterium]|jgi:uncharacterized protein YeaO (DUF488 family)|nr:DUF488 domain-containing protein [Ignavibacteriaceae bacterium]HRN26752.1 DUF488 domain-containing protein [Ignavibacteriaceae bacterium]HRP92671.1 DUF488 domain-containing protein [Ignavibacteriaceae bacterium]HRQ54820.1 DUF488 domain-containing protein [Ignavibacteriaceae bacterium]